MSRYEIVKPKLLNDLRFQDDHPKVIIVCYEKTLKFLFLYCK
jgi:hypothetical protein